MVVGEEFMNGLDNLKEEDALILTQAVDILEPS